MDVSDRLAVWGWRLALGGVVLIGFVLRLHGIHDPLLDHPGWRQGDTAAIARNFATLDFNPFHPQTDYNGPPPNYVELELQIVPFLAAILYKLFGVHEIFGRVISIAFSLGTVGVLYSFGRYVFGSRLAGLSAAALFAIYPGSVYYGRTFTPDTTMVFFLTAALYAATRWVWESDGRSWQRFWPAALLTGGAVLAKPVAIVALVPIAAMLVARFGLLGVLRRPQSLAFVAIALGPYAAYDAYLARIAEWHWASGITRLHVLPSLARAFSTPAAFGAKLRAWWGTFGLLRTTMLGLGGTLLWVVAAVVPVGRRARPLLFGWLAAAALYAYAVVTVERVDYYLYLVLPLAALWSGGFVAALVGRLARSSMTRRAALAAGFVAFALLAIDGRRAVAHYYHYDRNVYRAATALDTTLDPNALVVMGHYDPSVLYYINRKGWEEDPYLWTPFDEQSAIRKGARYFIAIENNRLRRNVELYAWLQRFPIKNAAAKWPVYETDPAKTLPGAEARWQEFRRRERAGELPKVHAPPVPSSS
ncbi:MAG: glycosyltransferase family 39 protein [Candidatus Baltobacteraceae bacterium]